jgi:hypothetical protein
MTDIMNSNKPDIDDGDKELLLSKFKEWTNYTIEDYIQIESSFNVYEQNNKYKYIYFKTINNHNFYQNFINNDDFQILTEVSFKYFENDYYIKVNTKSLYNLLDKLKEESFGIGIK